MTTATVKNWFYTQEPVEIDGTDGNPVCAYQNLPHRIPRPENEEDQIVLSFLNSTGRPEFDGRNIENYLRIALRRAAEAAVRATLDAEGQGVVYETAEERAAGKGDTQQDGVSRMSVIDTLLHIARGDKFYPSVQMEAIKAVTALLTANPISREAMGVAENTEEELRQLIGEAVKS